MTSLLPFILFILPSDNVQHDLQHGITHNFPERRKPRKQTIDEANDGVITRRGDRKSGLV